MTYELPPEPLAPEDYLLENNPSLKHLAENDPKLEQRLNGLRMAREFAAASPDNSAFQELPANMEQAVRDYVDAVGYVWEELQRPDEPQS